MKQKPHIFINHRLKVESKNDEEEDEERNLFYSFASSISFMPSAFGQVCRFRSTYDTQFNCCM